MDKVKAMHDVTEVDIAENVAHEAVVNALEGRPANNPVKLYAEGYHELALTLEGAFHQASEGKGKERHADNKPFLRQPIMEIGRMTGPGFAIGQFMKKGQEAKRMSDNGAKAAAIRELQGAIVYAAGAIMLLAEDL